MAAAGFSGVYRGRSMLKIAVLDDEKVFCDAIKRKLHSIYKKMQVVASVDEYHFGRELLYEVDDGAYYDIYLLEIKRNRTLFVYYLFNGISPVCD